MTPTLFSPRQIPSFAPHSNSRSLFLHNRPNSIAFLRRKCSSAAKSGEGMEESVSDMVDELLRKEENKALFDGLEAASRRVEKAKEALADIERQEAQMLKNKAYVRQLQAREAEIAESQLELSEARENIAEAQRFLSDNIEGNRSSDALGEDIDRGKERLESLKAAAVASIVGALASIPVSTYEVTSFSQLGFHLAVTFISCALFGVTFRYTVREDLDNLQLKSGTCAAFGFVKGLAALEAGKSLELTSESLASHAIDGIVYVSENSLIFLFAAVALDYCFKMRILSPFPTRK